ncbi:MAG: FmdB family zinc ribbon protein [Micromonosporaceae bacterium]
MPRYEYRCRACGDTFELTRPMAAAADAASCPQGHDDTVRLLSTVALTGRAGATGPGRAGPRPAAGGGCCGGACGC